ncbi:MAG: polysaccharide pyruvyl transferase family protein [Acidaminococcaceae bacterium]
MSFLHNLKILTRPWRRKVRNFVLRNKYLKALENKFADNENRRFILLLTPEHGNLGDHAITMGEIKMLGEVAPESKIIEISERTYEYCKTDLKKLIRKDDVLFIQGGGFFGSLYPESHKLRREIIASYPNNRIICLPVSIYYSADNIGNHCLISDKEVFNAHKYLTVMTRDMDSYLLAATQFEKSSVSLSPDCALAGEFNETDDIDREGILFIWRNDKEKILRDSCLQGIVKILPDDIAHEIIDNVVKKKFDATNRKEAVLQQLKRISKAKLVITDRFHGVVFAVLTNTPVIAYASLDTKITSGMKWFQESDCVYLANEEDDISGVVRNFLSISPKTKINNKLREILFNKVSEELSKRYFI